MNTIMTVEQMRDTLHKWKKTKVKQNNQRRGFDVEFKKMIVKYHYESNKTLVNVADEFDIHFALLSKWKRQYGKERTGIRIGQRLMNDVRTRCLAVKMHLEDNKTLEELAEHFGIKSKYTIANWVDHYMLTYNLYLQQLPDGVPWVASMDKMIYGDKNCKDYEEHRT